MMKDFCDRFLAVTDDKTPIEERAKQGLLRSFLSHVELAALVCEGNINAPRFDEVVQSLRGVCFSGELKSSLPIMERQQRTERNHSSFTSYYVHRDDARRYFARIDLDPPEGSALWCWLHGKPSDQAGKLRLPQQAKADFQQICLEVWERNPTLPITGPGGVCYQQRATLEWHRLYEPKTLEKWAREVAPPGVKGKRGRPRKISPEPEK